MEIAALFCQCWPSAIPTLISWATEIYLMQTQLDSWLKDLSAYQIAVEKELIWERYEFYKMTYAFCQQTGFVKK